MPPVVYAFLRMLGVLLRSQLSIRAETVALRHQLAIYPRTVKRPIIRPEDRILWSWLSRCWAGWREVLVFVQPATVIASTVDKYRVRSGKPPSPTWKTFLKSHLNDLVSIDFLIVPTIRFKLLYVLIVLAHSRRKVLHFNVTANPTAQWTAQQMTTTTTGGRIFLY